MPSPDHPPAQIKTIGLFNYNELAPEIANQVRSATRRIGEHMRRSVVEIGRELVTIKGLLPHGRFADWVRSELRIEPRSAQLYMSVAVAFGERCESVSYLPPKTLFALSAKSTPTSARTTVLERINAGHRPAEAEVADIIRIAKPPKLIPPVVVAEGEAPADDSESVQPLSSEIKRQAERLAKALVFNLDWDAEDISAIIKAGGANDLAYAIEWHVAEAKAAEVVKPQEAPMAGSPDGGMPVPLMRGEELGAVQI